MKYYGRLSVAVLLMALLPALQLVVAGSRVGGDADIEYESINAGGISYATNAAGTVKLGGSIGQSGLIELSTNVTGRILQSGFWKAESSCVLYQPSITNLTLGTNEIGITFTVVDGNMYQLLYVTEEEGGVPGGTHAFTNEATPLFPGRGSVGASTTIWDNVTSPTNSGRYYLIKCQ